MCIRDSWKDAKKAADAAACLKLTASDLLSLGVIDKIVKEKGRDLSGTFRMLKKAIRVTTERKLQMHVDVLTQERYERFRRQGQQGLI